MLKAVVLPNIFMETVIYRFFDELKHIIYLKYKSSVTL